jgi:uncharacterized membrane protein YcaP (DUF421 family)
MAFLTIVRAIWGYCFLIFIGRVVGRRPGKQLTPFEYVLIFYLGGLTLTGMVGEELSFTNAVCQIMTVAGVHWVITIVRASYPRIARILDGTPLVLLEGGYWRSQTMGMMGISEADVMAMARPEREEALRNSHGDIGEKRRNQHHQAAGVMFMPPSEHIAERVVDRIPHVDGAVAVGEDLDFQRR